MSDIGSSFSPIASLCRPPLRATLVFCPPLCVQLLLLHFWVVYILVEDIGSLSILVSTWFMWHEAPLIDENWMWDIWKYWVWSWQTIWQMTNLFSFFVSLVWSQSFMYIGWVWWVWVYTGWVWWMWQKPVSCSGHPPVLLQIVVYFMFHTNLLV